jgi:antitoxin component YwqK of YwqJK toxin-antitoxin module
MRILSSIVMAAVLALVVPACQKTPEKVSVRSGPKLEQRADKLFYEAGADKPYTGVQRGYEKTSRALVHECSYVNGVKEGWERRWFKDNPAQLDKQYLWVQGECAFYWQWWPNGNMRMLASQRDGSDFGRESMAYGSFVKWFEDGRVKFRAHYDEDFRWHGRVLDYDDTGTLMWDCVFNHGKYVSGHHPPDYKR